MTKLVISLLLITLCATATLQQNTDIEGHPGAPGLFPWFVFYQRAHGTWFSDACGGTILSSTWIITTANCGSPSNNTVYRILFGASQWEDEANAEQIIETTLFYRHPQFHDHAGNRTFNVGLMELPIEIEFSPKVRPINLPWDYTDLSFAGETFFIVTAKNQVDENGFNHNLRYNLVQILSDSECDAIRPDFRNNYEMCTTFTEQNPLHTPCGASPGTSLANFIGGNWTMVGSGADQGCGNTIPNRWARITDYLPWINEVTGLSENLVINDI